jgi:hypothetical protein
MTSLRDKMQAIASPQEPEFIPPSDEPPSFEVIDGSKPPTIQQNRPATASDAAEKGVIGSVLAEASLRGPEAARAIMFQLEHECPDTFFANTVHRQIFATLRDMHADNEPMDLLSVTNFMQERGVLDSAGGDAYLTELCTFVPTGGDWARYVDMLRRSHALRAIAALANQAGQDAATGGADPEIILQNLQSKARDIAAIAGTADHGIETMSFGDLMEFDTSHDADCVIGNRWLCRGGSLLLVGQSGIGKSSIAMQISMQWAQGRPIFGGLRPAHPLKVLFIQAENDKGDMAEMMQGVMRCYPLPPGVTRQEFVATMNTRMVFIRDTIHSGADFARTAAANIRKHRPDIVFGDPLLSYAGDDISQQKVASQFLRNTLNPIAFDTGIVWAFAHHTGKPSTDPKAKAHWNDADFSYMAFGSSELVNWARATVILRSLGEGRFEMRFGKRRNRTGIREFYDEDTVHPEPQFTDVIYLQHAKEGIYWEQIQKPDDVDAPKRKRDANGGQFQQSVSLEDVFDIIKSNNTGRRAKEFCQLVCSETGISKETFYRRWKELKNAGRLIEKKPLWFAKE